MACVYTKYYRSEQPHPHTVAIPRKYQPAAGGLLVVAGGWLMSDEARGEYVFTGYNSTGYARTISFTDPHTAFAFKMRFG